ncbi:a-factor receptor [Ceratobasidium sp. 428]|nr:a-factor receptor [Ceratobasidium sp. 428]
MSRYFRLMALAGTDMAFSLPISLYELVHSLMAYPSPPWVSWNDTHEYIHQVGIRTYEGILAIPGHKTAYDINRWAIPGCAFLFFAFFGLSGEAMKQYKKTFWRVVAPFGIRPPAPGSSPEHQTASWPRRMAARITGFDRDHHITFSSEVGTGNRDAGELGVDQAPRLDDALDAKPQNSGKIEIEDLESQK